MTAVGKAKTRYMQVLCFDGKPHTEVATSVDNVSHVLKILGNRVLFSKASDAFSTMATDSTSVTLAKFSAADGGAATYKAYLALGPQVETTVSGVCIWVGLERTAATSIATMVKDRGESLEKLCQSLRSCIVAELAVKG